MLFRYRDGRATPRTRHHNHAFVTSPTAGARCHRSAVVRKNSVLLTQASARTRGAVRRVSLWHVQSRNLRGDAETSELKARRHSLEDPERQALQLFYRSQSRSPAIVWMTSARYARKLYSQSYTTSTRWLPRERDWIFADHRCRFARRPHSALLQSHRRSALSFYPDARHGIGFPIGARRLLRASTLVQHIGS